MQRTVVQKCFTADRHKMVFEDRQGSFVTGRRNVYLVNFSKCKPEKAVKKL